MVPPAFSPKAQTPFVLDASVVINLNASRQGRAVLSVFRNPMVVVDVVEAEIGRGNRQQLEDKDALDALVADGTILIARLEDQAVDIFQSLVIGPAISTLDDGEAATIACAVQAGAVAVIDERKATVLARSRFPHLTTLSTMDIFASEPVRSGLGTAFLKNAVFMALLHGRMQVPKPHLDWVVDLIGQDRALKCLSLPSFARKPHPDVTML